MGGGVVILKTSSHRPGRNVSILSRVNFVNACSGSNRLVVFMTKSMFFNDSRTESR